MNQIEQTISSIEVAEMVGKRHDHLIRDIKRYIEEFNAPNSGEVKSNEGKIPHAEFFRESTYIDAKGETRPCYNVTKKGCEFIAHKLTGVKGTKFTAKYINRFHDMEKQIENPFAELSQELQAVIVVDKRVTQVEQRVEKLENNMTITHEQIQVIKNRVNKVIVDLLGGYESNAYKDRHLRGKAYSRFNKDYCDYFRINARANTLAAKYDDALKYIDMWQPDTNLRIQIQDCNAQMKMGVA